MTPLELDLYLERIGLRARPRADLATLRALQARHVATIPFENLTPLLGLPVPLERPRLFEKMVRHRRGGYCFEQNLLFEDVLESVGFEVRGLLGRAGIEGTPVGRTHMVLLVTLEGSGYLVDVGYGGLVPTAPLRLELERVQETPNEPYRLVEHEEGYRLEVSLGEAWRRLYEFGLERQTQADYDVANWYTATSPRSTFTRTLVAARAEPGRRSTLRGRVLTTYRRGAEREERALASLDALEDALESEFGIELDAVGARERLGALV